MTALHLLALISDSGVPIFSKKKGNSTSLPFSTVASLSTVAMFCKNQGTHLISTEFEDGLIIWKEFEHNIIVIGIARDMSEIVVNELVNFTFHAMVLGVGIEELRSTQNVDRLKRDLKLSLELIDCLIEAVDNDLLMYNDSIMSSGNMDLSIKLNEYGKSIKSPYICLLVRQKIACATEAWWMDLDVVDRKLLVILFGILNTLPKEIPVFLPINSPTHAYRFIAINLTQNITVCMLCGPEPFYMELETITLQFWKNEINNLTTVEKCYPKNIPNGIEFGPELLGIMLVNEKMKRYLISKNTQLSGKRSTLGGQRLDILKTFFYQAVQSVKHVIGSEDDTQEDTFHNSEQYWSSDYYMCHALIEDDNILCVLYASSVRPQMMQILSKKILNSLLEDKNTCWQLY